MSFLLIITIALGAGAASFAVWYSLAGGKGKSDVVRRLESVEKEKKRAAATPLVRSDALSDVPALNQLLRRWGGAFQLQEMLTRSGIRSNPGRVLIFCAALALFGYLAAARFGLAFYFCVPAALACGALPWAFVAFKFSRRLRNFERNFPDALDLLARAVRAGHAFTTGLEMVAKELPEPVAGEFRVVFEEQNLGLPLKDALMNLAERTPLIDVRFFVTALLIQKETGGNLAEILGNLSAVIRERFQIQGEVRVRTAQGKLTALILIALPIMVLCLLRVVNPDYLKPLFEDVWGPYMLGTAAGMQVLGSIILWKIVSIEV